MNRTLEYQQGDVLLFSGVEIPKSLKPVKTNLLWKGQQHHHRVRGKFSITKKGDLVFLKSQGCELFHEEHKTLKIPTGVYQLSIVNEFDHWLEESRKVID